MSTRVSVVKLVDIVKKANRGSRKQVSGVTSKDSAYEY